MNGCSLSFFATIGLLCVATSAIAAEIDIKVKVDAGDRQAVTEETLQAPSTGKPAPRPVLEFARSETARISWRAENKDASAQYTNVLVHFFVVKQTETGQAEVPKLTESVTYEGALTMDFKPRDVADWKWALKIHEPGSYLLRVETIGLTESAGHECYAAMDLVVK